MLMTADDLRKVEVQIHMLESHQQAERKSARAQDHLEVIQLWAEVQVVTFQVQAVKSVVDNKIAEIDILKSDLDATSGIVEQLKNNLEWIR
jgi:hypothetical protein